MSDKMSAEEKKRKFEELNELFSDAVNAPTVQNPEQLLATLSDLPDLPEVKVYDYEKDIREAHDEGRKVVESMAGLYLNNNDVVLSNPYIQLKIEHDANNHADMTFIKKMTQKALITQMKKIDLGDNAPRDFETLYNGMREFREIVKQSTASQNLVESFYKTLKDDLGIEEAPLSEETATTSNDDNTNIVDQKSLNDKLSQILKRRKSSDEQNNL